MQAVDIDIYGLKNCGVDFPSTVGFQKHINAISSDVVARASLKYLKSIYFECVIPGSDNHCQKFLTTVYTELMEKNTS